ncbi:amino acid adenylation domain-containing protein [Gloeocapsopsis crepidinum LEGE 06123]|uniref:Amino acid adenylation domain-containing protein n=1 Tax=Gloeocapsopsis crepidinum LEGE 06123 TaxID=588587 RepID=A0ABR9UQG0_9CHRO|nr:non-ribosomal peptide synthetase [Gloeocapsopsis crepidinum]MBE9190295.1 amino acid adenylation domain-containing protein [Gloeocapsopsis crepidinum LEGE 06123]
MSNLLNRIKELSPEQQEKLLEKLNQKKHNASHTKIQPQSRNTKIFPLSFAQQRLWFFHQLEPDSCAYNIPTAVRLTGNLNVTALSRSINELIRRHETLRTTFQIENGEAVQVIHESSKFELSIINLQFLAKTEQHNEVIKLATSEAQRPFNLVTESLLRVTLLQLGAAEHVVLFTMHHIVSDGWSTGILIKELTALYQAFSTNTPCILPKLPIQYADFAVWQRQWLQGEVLQNQLTYWKQKLGGTLPVLDLPTDRPRRAIQTDCGAIASLNLSESLSTAIKTLSQQQGVTLFMTLLAAFKLLLCRYTQQTDIIVGTPIANRNRSEIEGLIGFFVNTLVLRTDLAGNPSFRELLERVREVTLGAYTHQDLPFEQLVEELQPERDLSHNSLFQVMFILQNAPTETLQLPGLTLSPLAVESQTANFDLTLSMVETEQGLSGWFEYNTDLFDATRITRMIEHFQTLLTGIVANPDRRLSELPILTATEKYQILEEWNSKSLDVPQQCIHTLFEAQVAQTPDTVAIATALDEYLTYTQLNERANQLAHYLQALGVKPEVVVGICMERSLDLIVAVLAILKAGGAYLPLDPAYPQARRAFMLADAQVSILLTQPHLLASSHHNQVCLDNTTWEQIASEAKENPKIAVIPDNLAYVIYTSGSTGKSKGVMVAHRSLVNAYYAWEEAYQLHKVNCHLQMASFSFDVFAGDLVRALCSGGKLVLCPRDFLLEPQKLYHLMLQQQVDCAEFVPGVLRNLIEYLEQSQQHLNWMQLLICGSDSWYINEYKKFQNFCSPETRLINSFGLTEATIDSSYFEVYTVNLSVEQLVPIGRPFANTQIYILDNALQLVPVGVTGEIYIGGAALARGYLHQPHLTAQKFIPHIFSKKPSDRLYKTGDIGRYLPNGNIELLGRIDNQIKLRGFRIELGEIEAALRQYPEIHEAVVIVREDTPNQPNLIAYIVTSTFQHTNLQSSELRKFLQTRLPNYMVPSAFVELEKLPLTPNGKIDRRALPVPTQELKITFTPPRNVIEKTLANIWQEILNIEEIGIHNNFFELGGHSLLTTRLMLQIHSAFQVDLPLKVLFESPTIASLGESIHNILNSAHTSLSNEKETNLIDLNTEAVLDGKIIPEGEITTQLSCILLTGATGFLGAFLLYELLQQTQADIYCLIRASTLEEGKNKLQKNLESKLLWHKSYSSRIIPIIGNLSQPLLGLSEEKFQELAAKIDVIYHNGAWVHHIYPYSVLKNTNVLGTQEVLKLACKTKSKPLHYVSTSSVFSVAGMSGKLSIKEDDKLNDYALPDNGYVQTKWVSEKLVNIARARGLPAYIYRIGRVSGHSQTGVFNSNDFVYRLIIGCVHLGSVPNVDIMEDILPVDYVSQAIIHLSKHQRDKDKNFHLVNSQLLHTDMLLKVINSLGYQIQQISYNPWYNKLIDTAGSSPEHPLYPLVPFFSARESETSSQPIALEFDCKNTMAGLADTSIVCPAIDEKLLTTYISYMMRTGFL